MVWAARELALTPQHPQKKPVMEVCALGGQAGGPQIDRWLQALTHSSPTKAKIVREPVPGEPDERWGDSVPLLCLCVCTLVCVHPPPHTEILKITSHHSPVLAPLEGKCEKSCCVHLLQFAFLNPNTAAGICQHEHTDSPFPPHYC